MSFISCKNLELAYEGRCIVSDLNFEINQGDYLCIVGENGSGKTTLMKTLLGLKKPSKGEIVFGGDLNRHDIGYLPQQTKIQRDFPASVKEVVLSGCLNQCGRRPFYRKKDREAARHHMEWLGICDIADKCYRELSGGQQQRVLLARALCAAGKMLVLDEPVTGLDPKAAADMYEIIEKLNHEREITMVMVSHDINAAIAYGSHILHVSYKPLFFGKKEDYIVSAAGIDFMERTEKKL